MKNVEYAYIFVVFIIIYNHIPVEWKRNKNNSSYSIKNISKRIKGKGTNIGIAIMFYLHEKFHNLIGYLW